MDKVLENVFILEQGEDYEGSHILGIYSNEVSALWDLAKAFNSRVILSSSSLHLYQLVRAKLLVSTSGEILPMLFIL